MFTEDFYTYDDNKTVTDKDEVQWSLQHKTIDCPTAVTGWSLVGVRSDIRAQNVQKILFGVDKGRSHKTSRSLIRGSLVAGTTVSIG